MYHHSFACTLESISLSCAYNELNIVSAKYGTILENSFISNLCNNDYIHNQTFLQSFASNIDSLQFASKCDITSDLQSLPSFNQQSIDSLLSSNPHCNQMTDNIVNIPQSYLFEVFYYCPPPQTQTETETIATNTNKKVKQHNNMDNELLLFDLSHFLSHNLINPSSTQSTYYLCLIIIVLLSLLSLCACYHCCIQCVRCYTYNYLCCYWLCCSTIIKHLCCCEFCHHYNWFYHTNQKHPKQLKHTKTLQQKTHFANILSADLYDPQNIKSKNKNIKYNHVSEHQIEDKLRIAVHSLSPNLSPLQKSSIASNNTTPIPQENLPINSTNAPIIPYNCNQATNPNLIFQSPASIELSPISTASQIGCEINTNYILKSPPQSVSDITNALHTISMENESEKDKDRKSSPELILPSDGSDIEHMDTDAYDEEIEHMLPGININVNRSKSKSKSYKTHLHKKKNKKKRRKRRSINDSGSDGTGFEVDYRPKSTRVRLGVGAQSKSINMAKNELYQFDSMEAETTVTVADMSHMTTTDMTNVVMVNYDSSPDMKDENIYSSMDQDDMERSNGSMPINEFLKNNKSIDSTNYHIMPDFMANKSNKARNLNGKDRGKSHGDYKIAIPVSNNMNNRDNNMSDSSGGNSPLKLVKAATWNGRTSEIIELFDIENVGESLKSIEQNEDGAESECEQIGLYENANSGHIFSASLEQYPLAAELNTIHETSHTLQDEEEMDDAKEVELNSKTAKLLSLGAVSSALYIDMNDLIFIQLIGNGGGHSRVFEGQWKESRVCIKMYDPNYSYKKLKNELRISCNKIGNHPHILTIYGYTFDAKHNSFGIIQQLMSHGSAYDAIRKQKFQTVPTLLMLKYACCGLLHLHEMGIVHRNFNTKHILLDVSGKCVISDFGQAKKITSDHGSGDNGNVNDSVDIDTFNIIATTPPEVMTNKTYSFASDVYSFGIASWELFTQRIPFDGEYRSHIDAQIKINQENLSLSQYNIPDDIFLLLSKCLRINSMERPSLNYIIKQLNQKLYKYRLLNTQRSIISLPKSMHMYSAPVPRPQQPQQKRPSLVPIKQRNVSAPFPIQQQQHMSPVHNNQYPIQLQYHYTYSHAPISQSINQNQFHSRTNPATPVSASSNYKNNTPPPPLALSNNDNMNNHNKGPPIQPIPPPPPPNDYNAINPTNIILAKIDSQSVFE